MDQKAIKRRKALTISRRSSLTRVLVRNLSSAVVTGAAALGALSKRSEFFFVSGC